MNLTKKALNKFINEMDKIHKDDTKKYECNLCNKNVYTHGYLIIKHPETKNNIIACIECCSKELLK